MKTCAHGSFAFKSEADYTLISIAESWNAECIEIYKAVLIKRMESTPKQKRCVIFDGRAWGFQTPECCQKFVDLNQLITGYFKSLHIAYYLTCENFYLSTYLLNQVNDRFKAYIQWNFFQNLTDATSWLNAEGFDLPPLTDRDFPEPVPATHYLKSL